ncbi:Ig-like domain repeat protein [Tunturiibacter gelidiferens]|uniref:Ig-like domain repeat protein n=1 Tax=Tunturiibacter gelidiferens TaxID=3069689 RepID=UPI003D9BF9E0
MITGTPVATSTILTANPNPACSHQVVSLTAQTIRPGTPNGITAPLTGTVQLLDGATVLADLPLASGQVSFSTDLLSPGQHALTAV